MDISRRLMGRCAAWNQTRDDVEVDFQNLIYRLILFDRYILDSILLKEIPHLLKMFGFSGLLLLLESGVLKIHCHSVTIGQLSNVYTLRLPFNTYEFSVIRRALQWEQQIYDDLRVVYSIESLNNRQRRKLAQTVRAACVEHTDQAGEDAFSQLLLELRCQNPEIRTITAKLLGKKLNADIKPLDFDITLHPLADRRFQLESNIASRFNLEDQEVHSTVQTAILALAGRNMHIEDMRTYNALSGFKASEVSIFEDKLAFLAHSISPEIQEDRIHRVVEIAGLPHIKFDSQYALDTEKLLRIRDTSEAQEFRAWLRTVDSLSDEEIRKRISGLRAKLAQFFHSGTGQIIRFVATEGIGTGLGPLVGAAIGILDTFLLDKVLPRSGPVTFISSLYPSIFKEN